MDVWIFLSIVALLPMLLRTRKALSRLRVDAADPARFARPFSGCAIHAFTGYASAVQRRGDNITTGQIDSRQSANGGYVTSVRGSIDTRVVVTDSFFLTGADGTPKSFELVDFRTAIADGQLVSVVWLIKRLRASGSYFLVRNHTTGETFFHDETIRRGLAFPYPQPYVVLLCLMILPIPVVLLFRGLASLRQVPGFKSKGVQPLLDALDSAAAAVPVPVPARPHRAAAPGPASGSVSSELKDLAALRAAGDLSDSEFEAAKAKLLNP